MPETNKTSTSLLVPKGDRLLRSLNLAPLAETSREKKGTIEKSQSSVTHFNLSTHQFHLKLFQWLKNLTFGKELSMDLMWIYWKTVLHIVDIAVVFLSAKVLVPDRKCYGKSVKKNWDPFLLYDVHISKIGDYLRNMETIDELLRHSAQIFWHFGQ